MATGNETIIFNMSQFFFTMGGSAPFTAWADTGTMASVESTAPRAVMNSGMFNTVAFSVINSTARRVTVNILPNSTDDALMWALAEAQSRLGRPQALSLTYQGTLFTSGSCMIEDDPARNYIADNVEVLSWPIIGVFPIATVAKYIAPPTLTAAEVTG